MRPSINTMQWFQLGIFIDVGEKYPVLHHHSHLPLLGNNLPECTPEEKALATTVNSTATIMLHDLQCQKLSVPVFLAEVLNLSLFQCSN